MSKCPICDEKFNDEKLLNSHVDEHTNESILNEPDLTNSVRALRAGFNKRMLIIIQNMSALEKLNAEKILLKKNGKQRPDLMKWKLLASEYPKIAQSASEKFKEKFPKIRNPVTLENYHDDEILLELTSKREPKKSRGKIAKVEEKVEKILEKIDSLEERLKKLEKR